MGNFLLRHLSRVRGRGLPWLLVGECCTFTRWFSVDDDEEVFVQYLHLNYHQGCDRGFLRFAKQAKASSCTIGGMRRSAVRERAEGRGSYVRLDVTLVFGGIHMDVDTG